MNEKILKGIAVFCFLIIVLALSEYMIDSKNMRLIVELPIVAIGVAIIVKLLNHKRAS
ncbi:MULTISPECIES: hypothetical protein [unclassified Bacillus (in: firmicutes)]|uniref:hypothetical protein n=1 Tax=unclassified Bacillus (in: firmicutes) TaxID=185979 RepID=UPI0008EFB690|nr:MULTISPECIES: hypothetical protein [unclassified Bacillus (in: firmicutes)]SFI36457.1 hypothetical protein SAMN04488574_102468 [Bacillus sp. 71mf]SFT24366.1 hypothetical protein SAMN04488145_1375 [Bacillus sp. 103mf]SFT24657.1 hypothetical protein SAMN04488145_1402 [Bacillus sp. 103mf]